MQKYTIIYAETVGYNGHCAIKCMRIETNNLNRFLKEQQLYCPSFIFYGHPILEGEDPQDCIMPIITCEF